VLGTRSFQDKKQSNHSFQLGYYKAMKNKTLRNQNLSLLVAVGWNGMGLGTVPMHLVAFSRCLLSTSCLWDSRGTE